MKSSKNNQKSKTINNNNNTNSKLNEKQSPRELIVFKKIIQENNCNFIVFKSVYDLILIVFIDIKYSIIMYNLIDNKKILEIKNANAININELKHYLDKKNKRDLLSSITMLENNIKVWNLNNLECILNIDFRVGNFFLIIIQYAL
jgi:hypothetical protein